MNQDSRPGLIRSLLSEHPALLVSVVYVAASTIGMVYSWDYLRHFGINVFNYAQIGDFLLASLKEPFTWLLVIAALVLMVLDNTMSLRAQRKGTPRWLRWYGSNRYRAFNHLVTVGMILLFLHVYADNRVEETLAGNGEMVRVLLADGSKPIEALLLGTTGQFIFLFDATTGRVDIHPNENVQTISLTAPTGE